MFEGITRDPYLIENSSYKRLKDEYLKYGKLIIAFDFDNTVYDYHKKGDTFNNVINLLRKLKDYAYLIVFTNSPPERYSEIENYLKEQDIPYNGINENAPSIKAEGRKIYYNVLLDDRAGLLQVYNELSRLYDEVIEPKRNSEHLMKK